MTQIDTICLGGGGVENELLYRQNVVQKIANFPGKPHQRAQQLAFLLSEL